MWLFIQTHWAILAVTFIILGAVTGMGALTRFIEAIDKKLIIEAKPRQPQRLTSTQCFRGCRFGSFGFSLLERCFGPLLAAAPMARLKRSHPSGRSSITVFAFDLPIMAFALESSGSYVPRDR